MSRCIGKSEYMRAMAERLLKQGKTVIFAGRNGATKRKRHKSGLTVITPLHDRQGKTGNKP